MAEIRIGVDIGGSGIKAGLVDLGRGRLKGGRARVDTPSPSTPEAVAEALAGLVTPLAADGVIGIGFPSVIRKGFAHTASNIDESWIGTNAAELFSDVLGGPVVVLNDADAAGLAEARYGAARDVSGKVVVLTFGTGIGSVLLHDGTLVPNLELGQLELNGVRPAELAYSAKARKRDRLSWEEWGLRLRDFVILVDQALTPDLIVVGGGISKHWEKYAGFLGLDDTEVVPASLGNNAGIVGAAAYADLSA